MTNLSTAGNLPVFADTTGQLIDDSGQSLAAIVAELASLSAVAGNIDLFAIGGQSNAVGAGEAFGPFVPTGKVLQYKAVAKTISDANDPLFDGPNSIGDGSAWPSFGATYYRATGRRVAFVSGAEGGTAQCAASPSGDSNWDVSGTLRGTFVTNINAALTALTAAGYVPRFAGILWCQGENDAAGIQTAAITQSTYITALQTMIAYYRAQNFGGTVYPQLPFYISQTGGPAAGDNDFYRQIREAQATVAQNDATGATRIVFGGAVDFIYSNPQLASPTNGGSNLHYTQAGYNKMGHDMAQGVLLGGESKSRVAQYTNMLQFGSGTGTISPGTTQYLGHNAIFTGAEVSWRLITETGRIKKLTVYCTPVPTGGDTITATIVTNAGDSPVSVVLNAAATLGGGVAGAVDLVNEVVVPVTTLAQAINLRVVSTGGISASTTVQAVCEFVNQNNTQAVGG